MRMTVIVTFSEPGFHYWPDAPKSVEYLASDHRHLFKFRAEARVTEVDREVEMHTLQAEVRHMLDSIYNRHVSGALDFGAASCEMIALSLMNRILRLQAVEVWEDDENGARVERDEPRREVEES